MSSWLQTLFLAQPRWPAPPCLPPDDDPRWDALSGLGDLDGLLGDGRDGGLGQHDGHQVDLDVPAGQPDLPAGSPRQCCLDVNLRMQNIQMQSKANVRKRTRMRWGRVWQ